MAPSAGHSRLPKQGDAHLALGRVVPDQVPKSGEALSREPGRPPLGEFVIGGRVDFPCAAEPSGSGARAVGQPHPPGNVELGETPRSDVLLCNESDILKYLHEAPEGTLGQVAGPPRCREIEAALQVTAEPPRLLLIPVDAIELPCGGQYPGGESAQAFRRLGE